MNMLRFAIVFVLAVHGVACGSSSDQPTAAAAAESAWDANSAQAPRAPAAPAGTATQPQSATASGDRGAVAARVNGKSIYQIDVDSAMVNFMQTNNLGPDLSEQQRQEARKTVLDGLIGSELLSQKAKSIPIQISQAEVDAAISQFKASVGEEGFSAELQRRSMVPQDLENLVKQNQMVQKMIQETVLNTVQVSEVEMKKFYDENQSKMVKPQDVEASHILVKSSDSDAPEKRQEARSKIEEALKRVKAGEDFAAMAKEYSDDGSASRGGALGSVQRGRTVPAFEEAAFKLDIGQVSDVVETQFGFHIIKVTGKHESEMAKFEEARDRIADFLKQQKSRAAIDKLVDSLRTEAKIELL